MGLRQRLDRLSLVVGESTSESQWQLRAEEIQRALEEPEHVAAVLQVLVEIGVLPEDPDKMMQALLDHQEGTR